MNVGQKEVPVIIRETLDQRDPASIENGDAKYRESAVLIPFLREEGEYKILFTKRTHKVDDHKGQISFPGGGVEREDRSFQDTALRETHEEVGILPEDITVLGRMDDARTLSSNFLIHPFVGHVPYPYEFVINQREVKRILLIPLNLFFPGSPRADERGTVEYEGRSYVGQTYHYDGEVIWGATARLMKTLIDLLGEKIDLLV